jgi:hypothetical protein
MKSQKLKSLNHPISRSRILILSNLLAKLKLRIRARLLKFSQRIKTIICWKKVLRLNQMLKCHKLVGMRKRRSQYLPLILSLILKVPPKFQMINPRNSMINLNNKKIKWPPFLIVRRIKLISHKSPLVAKEMKSLSHYSLNLICKELNQNCQVKIPQDWIQSILLRKKNLILKVQMIKEKKKAILLKWR